MKYVQWKLRGKRADETLVGMLSPPHINICVSVTRIGTFHFKSLVPVIACALPTLIYLILCVSSVEVKASFVSAKHSMFSYIIQLKIFNVLIISIRGGSQRNTLQFVTNQIPDTDVVLMTIYFLTRSSLRQSSYTFRQVLVEPLFHATGQ